MRYRCLLLSVFAACCAWPPGDARAQGYYPYPPAYYAPGYYPPAYYRPPPPAYYPPPPYYAPPPSYGSANCGTPDRFKPCYR